MNTRLSEKAKNIIEAALNESSPEKCISLFCSLLALGNTFISGEFVTEYDSKTADPKRREWKPCLAWDGKAFIDGMFSGAVSIPRGSKAITAIENFMDGRKESLLKIGNSQYLIRYVQSRSEQGGTTPAYYKFSRIQ